MAAHAKIDTPPRYIAVVRRGETEVYRMLKEYLEARGLAEVIWDRRVADRRLQPDPAAAERRRGERRGPPPGASSRALGFFIARAGEPAPTTASPRSA
ncbi:MAG TPA: hypothetical protein VGX21_08735 [Methylomirabilota bacterium]|nr:hypothetical protein [Methylomirabilota bacterium]